MGMQCDTLWVFLFVACKTLWSATLSERNVVLKPAGYLNRQWILVGLKLWFLLSRKKCN